VRLKRRHVFIVLFFAAALIATYVSFHKIPHSLVLHINDRWHVMLVGETRATHLDYHAEDFVTNNSDAGNLWLTGAGKLQWQAHAIVVQASDLLIDHNVITTSSTRRNVHLMLYPDGRISKGRLSFDH